MLLVEELHDRLGHDRADPLDAVDLGERGFVAVRGGGGGLAERIEVAKVARQQPRIGLADMADAERVDEAVELDLATRLDRAHQID